MCFPTHSVVPTGYTTPTLWFSGYTKPPHGCNVTYIKLIYVSSLCMYQAFVCTKLMYVTV